MPMTLMEIPPLYAGDRLTREEFEIRYEAMPHIKAELIEGEVYVASPVSWAHADPHLDMATWAGLYSKFYTPCVGSLDNVSMDIDDDNEYQPDLVMFVRPGYGGDVERNSKDHLVGTPELVIEIAATSASIDLGKKKKVYQRHGVREYIVWRVYDQRIDWFVSVKGKFQALAADRGILKSVVFPGLWLDPAATIAQDYTRIQEVLMEGVHSPEHAKYVAKMNSRKKQSATP